MSWTDESGNPECECRHLWSNHYHRHNWYGCEAPDCECVDFQEQSEWDRVVNTISQLNHQEEEEDDEMYDITGLRSDEGKEVLEYDCELHGKGWMLDCPTCQMSDQKIRGRYMGGHDE